MTNYQDVQEFNPIITNNKLRISLIEQLNISLKQQIQIKTDINLLKEQLALQKQIEQNRLNQHDKEQKCFLQGLENEGAELCTEHARCLHQMEHLEWHLEHKHNYSGTQKRCKAYTMNHSHFGSKTVDTMNMVNSSEVLIKSIGDLRRKIFVAKQKLEKKAEQKKIAENDLAKVRKDISSQKKYISTKRALEN